MLPSDPTGLLWWISAVELPILGGLFWLIWRTRRDSEASAAALRRQIDAGDADLRDRLSEFKLEVAKTYASNADLNAVERRLVAHLLRIEAKLDRQACHVAGDMS